MSDDKTFREVSLLKDPDFEPARTWISILCQGRVYFQEQRLLRCMRQFKNLSIVLMLIQKSFELKIEELTLQDSAIKKPFRFDVDLSAWLNIDEDYIYEVPFTAYQAVLHLETILSKCFNKTIDVESYFEILFNIVKNITKLCHVLEEVQYLSADDEWFCGKALPLLLRLGVIMYPVDYFPSSMLINKIFGWISTFLLSDYEGSGNSEELTDSLGMKICEGTLQIFTCPEVFSIISTSAIDCINLLKRIIDSKFRTRLLHLYPVIVGSLFTSCSNSTGNAEVRKANYWLAVDMAIFTIRIIAETDIQECFPSGVSRAASMSLLFFESNRGVKLDDGEEILCNQCLMTYLVTIVLSEVIMIIPQVLSTKEDIRVGSVKGCLVLIQTATVSTRLLKMLVKAICCDVEKAISLKHTTRIAASALLLKHILQINGSEVRKLDDDDFPYKDLLNGIINQCLAGDLRFE